MVIFTSLWDFERAFNISTVYDAYDGEKTFVKLTKEGRKYISETKCDLVVTDEVVNSSASPVITLGHGIGGAKHYGFDQPNPYFKKQGAELLKYAVIASSYLVEKASKQLGIPESRILPLGMPRTDLYFGKKKGDGKTPYSDKKVYLYAPTFGTSTYIRTSWHEVDRSLTDDEIFLIKPHPVVGDLSGGDFKHIRYISSREPSEPYLIDCDVCITDYSSIMFDAHILDKPVVLYAKDYEYYRKSRGMYFDYPKGYSDYHTTNGFDLLKLCRISESRKEKFSYFYDACDGHSVERIVDLIKRSVNK